MPVLKIKKESDCKDLPTPSYQTSGSAGFDLYAAINGAIMIDSGEHRLISSGLRMQIPPGYEIQIRPRSGLANKYGLSIVNSPGTIDSDYRGVIGIILINHGSRPIEIKRGDRIAQAVLKKVEIAKIEESELDDTERSDSGFGSTDNNQ